MTLDLTTITLTRGTHHKRSAGVCLMEATAWWAGEPHSIQPSCVSAVLSTYGRLLNDTLPDGKRQQLKDLIPALAETARDGRDETRGYLALDWLVRTWVPAWLQLAGYQREATNLANLTPITTTGTAREAGAVITSLRAGAAALNDVLDTTWGAALGAALDDVVDAAQDAARYATWYAMRSAALEVARSAAVEAAWNARRDDVWTDEVDDMVSLAQDVAEASMRAAALRALRDTALGTTCATMPKAIPERRYTLHAALGTTYATLQDAATSKLAPTVDALQDSAIALFRRMIGDPE